MKNFIFLLFMSSILLMTLSCSNVERPAESDEKAKELLGKLDGCVANIMRKVRTAKDSEEKISTELEQEISTLIEDAKAFQKDLLSVSDKLSEKDFATYERVMENFEKKESEFNSLKQ